MLLFALFIFSFQITNSAKKKKLKPVSNTSSYERMCICQKVISAREAIKGWPVRQWLRDYLAGLNSAN